MVCQSKKKKVFYMIAMTVCGDNVFVLSRKRKQRTGICEDISIKVYDWKVTLESLTSVTGRVSDASNAFSHCIRRTAEDAFRKGSAWF